MPKARKSPGKSPKKKMGRPETDVQWIGIGVRFTAQEKIRLRDAAKKFNLSQANLIRHATIKLIDEIDRTGRLEISVAP